MYHTFTMTLSKNQYKIIYTFLTLPGFRVMESLAPGAVMKSIIFNTWTFSKRGFGSPTVGKLPPNEKRMVEFFEREAKKKREAVFAQLCLPIIEQLQKTVSGLGVRERAPHIPRTREAFAELFKMQHRRSPTVQEANYLFTSALTALDPGLLTTLETREQADLELAINELFLKWKAETDVNYRTQMGRSLEKSEAALVSLSSTPSYTAPRSLILPPYMLTLQIVHQAAHHDYYSRTREALLCNTRTITLLHLNKELGEILGRMPRGNETDRMWLRKQVFLLFLVPPVCFRSAAEVISSLYTSSIETLVGGSWAGLHRITHTSRLNAAHTRGMAIRN
jgi:hypothetical protein